MDIRNAFWDFWNKKAGMVGILVAFGWCLSMIGSITITPCMPFGWDAAAGLPAMQGNVAFPMKDVVSLTTSFYLLKQDVVGAARSADERR